jgi:RNA polymerase sigma-70 factor, ECF subfamily
VLDVAHDPFPPTFGGRADHGSDAPTSDRGIPSGPISPSRVRKITPAAEVAAAVEGQDFRSLYEEYFPLVWRWATRLGVMPSSLDDVVQEIFLTIYTRVDEFEGRSSLKTWIFGVTLGVTRNYRRRRGAGLTGDGSVELDAFVADGGPHPEAVAQQSEEMALLNTILDGLDDEKREVFVLAELEELSMTEIAQILGLNPNTVSSRLRLARQAVRAAWERAAMRDGWRLR